MLRLITFGGLSLVREGATPTSLSAQRRPLAVLALLAGAGAQGMSRDKIVALLWPESTEERARHTLTQAMYSLRRQVGTDDLFVTGADVRLNPAVITSDVIDFDAAIEERRFEDAVGLYRGSFLDGFHVSEAADFTWWLDGRRSRLEQQCQRALDHLAQAARSEGRQEAVVEWCRRAAAIDMLDSGRAQALVAALIAAGDASGAIRHARAHESRLREDMDLPLPPAIAALLKPETNPLSSQPTNVTPAKAGAGPSGTRAELNPRSSRRMPGSMGMRIDDGSLSGAKTLEPGMRRDDNVGEETGVTLVGRDDRASGPEPLDPGMRRDDGVLAQAQGRSWLRRRLLAAGAVAGIAALVLLGVWFGRPGRAAEAATPTDDPATDRVAIASFMVKSQDPALGTLAERVPEILAPFMAEDGGPVALPIRALLATVRTEADSDLLSSARETARRLSTDVIVGEVSGDEARTMIRAAVVAAGGVTERHYVSVHGALADLSLLLDTLAVKVRAERMLAPEQVARLRESDPDAIRAYLRGLAAYRGGQFDVALQHFSRAVHYDSTFGLAGLGLVLAADKLNSAEEHDQGLELAWAARATLSSADRAHLEALAGSRYPEPPGKAEQIAAWERAVMVAPDRPEAWQELGERFVQDGRILGIADADERAEAAFRQALALQPDFVPAQQHLLQLAVRRGDTATLRRMRLPAGKPTSSGDLSDFLRWRVAVALGDAAATAKLRQRMDAMPTASLRAIAMASEFDGLPLDDAEHALATLASRAVLEPSRTDVVLAQHSLMLNAGRIAEALDATERLDRSAPGQHAHLRLRVLDALYSNGDTIAAAAAAAELAVMVGTGADSSVRTRSLAAADRCVLGQWQIARGDTRDAPAMIARLRREPRPAESIVIGAVPAGCAQVLEAMLAVAEHRPDARAYVEKLAATVFTGPLIGDARTYATLALERMYEGLGEPASALTALRRGPYMRGWPRYLSTALAVEARLATQLGDQAGAERALDGYRALRRGAPDGVLRTPAGSP